MNEDTMYDPQAIGTYDAEAVLETRIIDLIRMNPSWWVAEDIYKELPDELRSVYSKEDVKRKADELTTYISDMKSVQSGDVTKYTLKTLETGGGGKEITKLPPGIEVSPGQRTKERKRPFKSTGRRAKGGKARSLFPPVSERRMTFQRLPFQPQPGYIQEEFEYGKKKVGEEEWKPAVWVTSATGPATEVPQFPGAVAELEEDDMENLYQTVLDKNATNFQSWINKSEEWADDSMSRIYGMKANRSLIDQLDNEGFAGSLEDTIRDVKTALLGVAYPIHSRYTNVITYTSVGKKLPGTDDYSYQKKYQTYQRKRSHPAACNMKTAMNHFSDAVRNHSDDMNKLQRDVKSVENQLDSEVEELSDMDTPPWEESGSEYIDKHDYREQKRNERLNLDIDTEDAPDFLDKAQSRLGSILTDVADTFIDECDCTIVHCNDSDESCKPHKDLPMLKRNMKRATETLPSTELQKDIDKLYDRRQELKDKINTLETISGNAIVSGISDDTVRWVLGDDYVAPSELPLEFPGIDLTNYPNTSEQDLVDLMNHHKNWIRNRANTTARKIVIGTKGEEEGEGAPIRWGDRLDEIDIRNIDLSEDMNERVAENLRDMIESMLSASTRAIADFKISHTLADIGIVTNSLERAQDGTSDRVYQALKNKRNRAKENNDVAIESSLDNLISVMDRRNEDLDMFIDTIYGTPEEDYKDGCAGEEFIEKARDILDYCGVEYKPRAEAISYKSMEEVVAEEGGFVEPSRVFKQRVESVRQGAGLTEKVPTRVFTVGGESEERPVFKTSSKSEALKLSTRELCDMDRYLVEKGAELWEDNCTCMAFEEGAKKKPSKEEKSVTEKERETIRESVFL